MDKVSNSGDIDAIAEEPSMSDNRTSAVSKKPSRDEAEAAVRTLISFIGEDADREGLIDTPGRVVRAWVFLRRLQGRSGRHFGPHL